MTVFVFKVVGQAGLTKSAVEAGLPKSDLMTCVVSEVNGVCFIHVKTSMSLSKAMAIINGAFAVVSLDAEVEVAPEPSTTQDPKAPAVLFAPDAQKAPVIKKIVAVRESIEAPNTSKLKKK